MPDHTSRQIISAQGQTDIHLLTDRQIDSGAKKISNVGRLNLCVVRNIGRRHHQTKTVWQRIRLHFSTLIGRSVYHWKVVLRRQLPSVDVVKILYCSIQLQFMRICRLYQISGSKFITDTNNILNWNGQLRDAVNGDNFIRIQQLSSRLIQCHTDVSVEKEK